MSKEEWIWVAFEGAERAKKHRRADLEHEEQKTNECENWGVPHWLERLFVQQELWELEGSVPALFDILEICNEEQIVLPLWAKEALQDILIRRSLGEAQEVTRTGRVSTPSREHANKYLREVRKDTVRAVRCYQALEPCLFAFTLLPIGLKRIYSGKPLPDLGTTIEDALAHAHVALRGTRAQAAEETLRKAFFSSKNEIPSPWDRASPKALSALGFETDTFQYLPFGTKKTRPPNPYASRIPSQLMDENVLEMDEVSARYIALAQTFDDFDEFIEAARHKDVMP